MPKPITAWEAREGEELIGFLGAEGKWLLWSRSDFGGGGWHSFVVTAPEYRPRREMSSTAHGTASDSAVAQTSRCWPRDTPIYTPI